MGARPANASTACRSCGRPGTVDAAGRCVRTGLPGSEGPCGTRIDRYDVLEWVGGGGLGAVYRARHVALRQDVAVKLLRREHAHDAEVVERFLREAKATAAIQSPHVVRVTDFGTSSDGQPFLVMELLPGPDLERELERRGRLPMEEAVGLALDILAGLGAAHAAGIVHRDLKPANVLVGGDVVKVVDFGLAKVLPSGATTAGLTRTGAIVGTPHAIAPEQASGQEVDARADLWAAGALLYRALSGRRPWEGASAEDVLVRVCTEPPAPLGEVPEPLAAVVARALEREPSARWASAAEMSTALRTAMAAIDRAVRAAVPATNEVPAPKDEDDEEEEAVALRPVPGLRPSLAFDGAAPRSSWKLPLALVGFVAGAGALIALALVLRPTLPLAPPPPPRPSALPAYDDVAGVVVSVAPDRAAPPPAALAPSPPPPASTGTGVHVRLLAHDGPLAAAEIDSPLQRATRAVQWLREPAAAREDVAGTVHPNGAFVPDDDGEVAALIAQSIRFPPASAPTRIRFEVVLDAETAP